MRQRSKRTRMVAFGILFMFYTAFNVYTAGNTSNSPVDIDANDDLAESSKTNTILPPLSDEASASPQPNIDGTTQTPIPATEKPVSSPVDENRPRTYRQKRNCTPPAIEQFPPTILPPWFRERGGLIIHILIAMFTFLGLAIVCDDYFVSSLDRICEELRLSPDVAGATFMAAGRFIATAANIFQGIQLFSTAMRRIFHFCHEHAKKTRAHFISRREMMVFYMFFESIVRDSKRS